MTFNPNFPYFYKIEETDVTGGRRRHTTVTAKCKNCGHVQSNKAERMLNHATKCFNSSSTCSTDKDKNM